METTDIVLLVIGLFLLVMYVTTKILESQNKELEEKLSKEGIEIELSIQTVEVLNAHTLKVKFSDGAEKLFDALDLFMYKSFANLRDEWYFKNVRVNNDGSCLLWDKGEEFGVDMLYVRK